MAEVSQPVKTVLINYECDVEGCEGHALPDPEQKIAFMSDPIKFPHICNVCNKLYTFTDKYPKIGYQYT